MKTVNELCIDYSCDETLIFEINFVHPSFETTQYIYYYYYYLVL